MNNYPFLNNVQEWSNRLCEFLAVAPAPLLFLLGFAVTGDLLSGGLISTFLPWFQYTAQIIMGVGVVAQLYVCSGLAGVAFRSRKFGRSTVWGLLVIPSLAVAVVTNLITNTTIDKKLTTHEALAYLSLPQTTVPAMIAFLSVWTPFVADRIRRELKKQRGM